MQKAPVSAPDTELSMTAKAANNTYVAAEAMSFSGMQELVTMLAAILQPLYTAHSETARAMKGASAVMQWYLEQARGEVFELLENKIV